MFFCYAKRLSTNKTFEIELSLLDEWEWFNFSIKWSRKCDHAGVSLLIEFPKVFFNVLIHDNRHWDYDNDKFVE